MTKQIFLAGGCFWGTEHYFKMIDGVVKTKVGYANSIKENPTYKEVCSGETKAAETVMVEYDPSKISLEFLLEMYFHAIDPTSVNQQGHDVGLQYRTGIYFTETQQLRKIRPVFPGHYTAGSYHRQSRISPLLTSSKRWLLI